MREKIIEALQLQDCTYQDFKKKFKIKDKGRLRKILQELEKEGVVYQTEEEIYQLFPENFKIGTLKFTKKKNPYVEFEFGEEQYLNNYNLNGAIVGDRVIVNTTTIRVEKILERKMSKIVCEVQKREGKKVLKPHGPVGNLNIRIDQKNMKKLNDHDFIIVDVSLKKIDDYYEGAYIETIESMNEPDMELKEIAISNGFETKFNPQCIEQVTEIPTCVNTSDLQNRIDLRNKEILTIDGENTKDMDDAVSIEKLANGNYLLGVHIADVAHYVKENTPLYLTAKERGTSLYLVNSVIPMLPKELSNNICSLNPHVDRLAISCLMEIDQKGEMKDFKIFESVIHSKLKATYQNVDKVLMQDNEGTLPSSEYQPFINTFLLMKELSDIITIKKEKQGCLKFDDSEIYITEKNGITTKVSKKTHYESSEIIENFMIMANSCIATYIATFDFIPSIYRIHGTPNFQQLNMTIDFIEHLGYRIQKVKNTTDPLVLQKILKQLSTEKDFPILSSLILRSMKRAEYSTQNIGHFGLGLSYYTHFTSPIRRFPDLQVHHILKKIMHTDLTKLNLEKMNQELIEICHHASFKERQADIAEEEADQLKILHYMEQNIGQQFEGFVYSIHSHVIEVQTKEGIKGYITYENLPENWSYDKERNRLIDEHRHAVMKVGHQLILTAVDIDTSTKTTIFALESNITLTEKQEKRLAKTLIG